MRKNIILAITFICGLAGYAQMSAPARTGQYGFTQLMVNGWAQSSGMGNANSAGVSGVESFFWNIAGLGKVNGTELAFSRSAWLVGTGININSFGFAQAIGKDKDGVILAPYNTKEEAETAKKRYGYDNDNYYVDVLR
jgi:hypothetical protein